MSLQDDDRWTKAVGTISILFLQTVQYLTNSTAQYDAFLLLLLNHPLFPLSLYIIAVLFLISFNFLGQESLHSVLLYPATDRGSGVFVCVFFWLATDLEAFADVLQCEEVVVTTRHGGGAKDTLRCHQHVTGHVHQGIVKVQVQTRWLLLCHVGLRKKNTRHTHPSVTIDTTPSGRAGWMSEVVLIPIHQLERP